MEACLHSLQAGQALTATPKPACTSYPQLAPCGIPIRLQGAGMGTSLWCLQPGMQSRRFGVPGAQV